MKNLFLILLFISLTFAASYGPSRVTLERTWTLENIDGNTIDFKGALAVNNSNQQIMYALVEPEMDLEQDENGTVWLLYKAQMNQSTLIINATAIIDIYYDTLIFSDTNAPQYTLSYTDLTEPDEAIVAQAQVLKQENSSLQTIANLVNWVYGAMYYDVAYWGQVAPVQEVFQTKRGVCVEYTHLLISMSRSAGFDTRYVSGYVLASAWQPHAWAEIYIPEYGWIPVDPTLDEVGSIDNSHVAVQYAADQSFVYDSLLSQNADATLEGHDTLNSDFFSEDADLVLLSVGFDNISYIVDVELSNPQPEYLYGVYSFVAPSNYGQKESYVLLLEPYETLHIHHRLNSSLFVPGYYYLIPLSVSFNDVTAERTLNITLEHDSTEDYNGIPQTCAPSFLPFIVLGILFLIRQRRE